MKKPCGWAVVKNWGSPGRGASVSAALVFMLGSVSCAAQTPVRERIPFNADWRFAKGDPDGAAGKLSYSRIRNWVLVTGVPFAKDPNFANRERPAGTLGADVAYAQPGFDDRAGRR